MVWYFIRMILENHSKHNIWISRSSRSVDIWRTENQNGEWYKNYVGRRWLTYQRVKRRPWKNWWSCLIFFYKWNGLMIISFNCESKNALTSNHMILSKTKTKTKKRSPYTPTLDPFLLWELTDYNPNIRQIYLHLNLSQVLVLSVFTLREFSTINYLHIMRHSYIF